MSTKHFFIFFLCFFFVRVSAQKNTPSKEKKITKNDSLAHVIFKDSVKTYRKTKRLERFDVLSPSKAAFYSAILPGLGQAYNHKYWKIPIVYGLIGTAIYFYDTNNKTYSRYRNAYKRRLAGFEDDEFFGYIEDEGLRNAQKTLQRNKELSLLLTVGAYILNIIDANVDAHLMRYNVSDDLTLHPHYSLNSDNNTNTLGVTLNYKF